MSEITELQKKIKELEASAENDIDCILISIKVFSLDYSNPNRVADTIKLYEKACTITNNSKIKTETLAFLKKEAILSVRSKNRSTYNEQLNT